jgi:hypothetical protein
MRTVISTPILSASKAAFAICLTIVPLLFVSADAAQKTRKFVGLEFGYSTFQFDEKIDQKLIFQTLSLTAGFGSGPYNFLINYSSSLDSAEVSEEDFIGSADRSDIDLVMVRQFGKSFNIFAGYKTGETTLESFNREELDDGGAESRAESFEQEGPFLGFSANWAIEDAGRLSFSIAYADLNSTNRFVSDGDGADPDEAPEFDDITGTTQGKTTGLSYNLAWTMPLKGNWLFRSKIKVNRYKQNIEFQGVSFNGIKESSTSLLIGLIHVF